jgi:hypothetical protein
MAVALPRSFAAHLRHRCEAGGDTANARRGTCSIDGLLDDIDRAAE